MRLTLLVFFITFFSILNLSAQGLSFNERQLGTDKIIVCTNSSDKEFEVTLSYQCSGQSLSEASPIKKTITPYGEIEMVRISPIDGVSGSCSFNYTYTEIRHSRAKESPAYNYNGITVFGKNNCHRCDYFIDKLRNKNVSFQELNIDTYQADEDLMWETLKNAGFRGNSITTPIVVANGEVYYNIPDMDALLNKLKG